MFLIREKGRKGRGYTYHQIKRGKVACIYSRLDNGEIRGFDIFKIHINPERIVNGITLPAKEKFPHDEAFGKWAWSHRSYERAIEKFNELEEKI